MTRPHQPIVERVELAPQLVVLAHMLWDTRAAATAWFLLEPDDFRPGPARELFMALGETSAADPDASPLAVYDRLVGGELARGAPSASYLFRRVAEITHRTLDAWPVERLARRIVAERPRPAAAVPIDGTPDLLPVEAAA